MADRFLAKSFLFAVVDSETENIETSFTLVVPPNAYSIKEPHRVSIIKTFGNAFIDDYGPDNIQLVIKGISGTAHAFPTFKTDNKSAGASTFQRTQETKTRTRKPRVFAPRNLAHPQGDCLASTLRKTRSP